MRNPILPHFFISVASKGVKALVSGLESTLMEVQILRELDRTLEFYNFEAYLWYLQ
jgi:hypothetical protein